MSLARAAGVSTYNHDQEERCNGKSRAALAGSSRVRPDSRNTTMKFFFKFKPCEADDDNITVGFSTSQDCSAEAAA